MAGSENTTPLPGCINGLPKRGTRPGAHPDSELLFAWEAFQAAATAYQCAPDGETSRYVLMLESIGERIETFRPKTLDGAKIQLRCLLTKYLNADCAWDTLVFDDDPDQDFYDAVDDDPHAGALWNLIRPGDSLLDRIARRIRSRRGFPLGAHPDSMLLAAWDGYIEAMRAYARANAVPGASDADLEPFSRALSTFTRKIEETPARTMAGIAIQLRYLFAALVESHGATDAAIFGKAPLEALAADLDDARHRMLWRMIEEAERAADAAKGRNAGAHASTLIPALRLTFADASAKVLALLGEYQTAAGTRPDDPPDHLVVEASKLRRAVFTAPPQTPADALAVLNLLADGGAGLADGNRVDGQETAVTLLRDFMARQAASEQPV